MGKEDGAIKLAHRAIETRYENLTDQEILVTKKSILDTLGVILAGSTLGDKCLDIVDFVKDSGGKEESTILGLGGKVPAMMAVFANGALSHTLDYDDAYDPGHVHPTASTLPATLAVMERSGNLTGKELITAIAIGNDITCRLGRAAPAAIADGGLLGPMTMSTFGAAIASGKILNLTKDEMVSCLGLALTQVSGSAQVLYEGDSDVREIYQAFGGKSGVLAAMLAKKGIRGCKESLEGKSGFFNLFLKGNYDPSVLNVKMGDRYEGVNATFKPYPACRQTHPYIEATKLLISKYSIKPEDVEKATVKVGNLGMSLCTPEETRRKPAQATDARFSIPYNVAVCLVYGTVSLANFIPENLRDTKVLDIAQKIKWEFDEEIGKAKGVEPGIVTIQCIDGSIYTEKVSTPLGSVENPMSMDTIVAKFRDCTNYSAKPIKEVSVDRVIDLCLNLEAVSDINQIIREIS